ncbi:MULTISPECIES: S66 peptidase family protein [unclassified Fusibacter]|uniref:S66 family peptidase n=1 Tax=unclassified Fusibacter TaxID=2624464 RepID=UPI00101386ED|nr:MULTISPECIES: S66 peptidase family protein [unclassified Fusibacter]MCK8058228.1 LD-carboxypeptidase [Fusibacter sp. A2]NPE20811.1 LD-carboxypeptidase [Fusibacter sp. A1]RXV63015.1 LD-carboxypeptidase [Fusibacter sp. A1]
MKRLKKGDAIGVFSPSAAITAFVPERYQRAKAFLESKGFSIVEGSLTGKNDFYRSGTIKERADELNELIRNKEVRCIMSSIGGMNSNSILPYIDYEAFKADPKIIVGYSDVTAILLAIYEKTGVTPFYGPACVASFGEFPPFVDETYHYFSQICVEGPALPYVYPTPPVWTEEFIDWKLQDRSKVGTRNELVTVYEGCVSGRLIGGNLNTIMGIWGSEYMPEIRVGDILFIEDSLKDAATVERSFSLLKLNGVFDKVAGIIYGKHELFKDQGTSRKPYEILVEVLGDTRVPLLAEFDCSHTHPMLTLPIGANVTLDATNKKVILDQVEIE